MKVTDFRTSVCWHAHFCALHLRLKSKSGTFQQKEENEETDHIIFASIIHMIRSHPLTQMRTVSHTFNHMFSGPPSNCSKLVFFSCTANSFVFPKDHSFFWRDARVWCGNDFRHQSTLHRKWPATNGPDGHTHSHYKVWRTWKRGLIVHSSSLSQVISLAWAKEGNGAKKMAALLFQKVFVKLFLPETKSEGNTRKWKVGQSRSNASGPFCVRLFWSSPSANKRLVCIRNPAQWMCSRAHNGRRMNSHPDSVRPIAAFNHFWVVNSS